jgi:DNA-binding beta-propeller fold protein YncE
MKSGLAASLLWLLLGSATMPAAETNGAAERYAIVATVGGPDGMWDYAAVSMDEQRLYLAQGEHLSMLDLSGGDAWTQFGDGSAMWHGVVPLERSGLILATNGQNHTLTLFDAVTREVVSQILTSTGPSSRLSGRMAQFAALADPDAVLLEPHSGLAAVANGGSGEIVLIDLHTRSIVGRVQVGGKLEFAVADGKGKLYVNVQTNHQIAVIDVASLAVVRRIALSGCLEPKGLAYDADTDLLISGCDNGVAKFVLAGSAKVVATRKVGRGADAVVIDARRHRAYVPSGEDATLSIFDISDVRHIALLQTLATEKGVRLGALDERTGFLYLPSAKLGAPVPPHPWPSAVPGSFHILVVSSAGKP